MELDLTELYYEDNFQGSRLIFDEFQKYWHVHASNLSLCITKACLYRKAIANDIRIPFKHDSVKRMEMGKAGHYLHQKDVTPKLSELKDDRFGWLPHYDDRYQGAMIDEYEFQEVSMVREYKKDVLVLGRLDELLMDSKGLFIQDIKTTAGFKYVNEPKVNHLIQVHAYMWLSDESLNIIKLWAERQEQWRDVDTLIRRGRIKYVDTFNPMKVKIYEFNAKQKYFAFIKEQLDKFHRYVFYDELPKPNHKYMADWECNPKYCPFSTKEVCPLDEHCPHSRWEK